MIIVSISAEVVAFTDNEIIMNQTIIINRPVGERIVFWAQKFINTPYDPDPLGEYVRKRVIVADEQVDCMYLVFRSVELALSTEPEEAIEEALKRRFFTYGNLVDNKIVNYNERYQYAMDMILSKKWGREVTGELGPVTFIEGSRGWDKQAFLSKKTISKWSENLQGGDIIYFVKPVKNRIVGEIIGHLGIVDKSDGKVSVIHASGSKKKNSKGKVTKVSLSKYLSSVSFIGVKVTRF
jgi:hypothetical protein